MKSAESWVTTILMIGVLLLIVTHPGGFATDVTAGGSVLNNTVNTISGKGRGAGVNFPTGTPPKFG